MASISKQFDIAYQVARINRQLNKTADLCAPPVEETLLTQAALLVTEQKSLAPVGTDETAGELRDSIRIERGNSTAKAAFVLKVKAGGAKTTKQSGAGKPYDHARANEFGTQDMKAQPFFYPPYRARKKDMRAAVRKAVKLAVQQVFK